VSEAEIRGGFQNGWRIDSIEPGRLITTMRPEGAAAWLACIVRLSESR
jgi:hypothetical protein